MRALVDNLPRRRMRRTISEINTDYHRILKSNLTDEERLLSLCELMDELNVFYKLYEDGPKDAIALMLYKLIANSR